MNKLAFIDIGELGWSLYLSAHIRWLKKNSDSMIAVIGFPDRRCLYAGLADDIIDVPKAFYKKYDLNMQDSHKIRKVGWDELETFFESCVPKGYRFAKRNEYSIKIISDSRIFMPYKYSKLPEDGEGGYMRTEILIFPRCRTHPLWARRNLSEKFYLELIERLCDEFPKLTVRTIGTKRSAYDIMTDRFNYINWVGKSKSLQDMIDRCQTAIAAVGSQSALPKISLLQDVPTFIIGHQKERHIGRENWMNTKIGFYEIAKKDYAELKNKDCIRAVVAFVKEVQ